MPLTITDEELATIDLTPEELRSEIAVMLRENDKLDWRPAARLAGVDLGSFLDVLEEQGVPQIHIGGTTDADDAEAEEYIRQDSVLSDVRAKWPGPFPPWIEVCEPVGRSPEEVRPLGAGEAAAITPAVEFGSGLDKLLIDERLGRAVAEGFGLPVLGTFGLLAAAKDAGLVAEVGPLLDRLIENGARCSAKLRAFILQQAGEADPA